MIPALADLHFVRPQWLWLLLALPLLGLWWARRRRDQDAWRQRVDPHLLPHLLAPGSGRGQLAGLLLGLSTLALAILAMAGPGWRAEQRLWQESTPLVIALDLSSASAAGDLQPSRLLQARAAIDTLLQARTGGEVALVAFAADAHTVAPLTADVDNVRVFLDALAPDIMPADGSDPARAIAWSAGLLERAGMERGVILVMTHQADAGARRAAAAASRAGYTVSVLGLGTAEGALHRDAGGRLVHSRMDAGSLQALADAGSGRFVALAADGGQAFAGSVPGGLIETAGRAAGGSIRSDQGYWLLLPLLLLAALAFRRGAGLLVLALASGLPLVPVQAQEGSLWHRPDQIAHERGVAAVEAYRRGNYEAAAEIWAGLDGARSDYNRGNALARAGLLEEAIAAYDEALAREPGLEDAVENRRIVEEALQQQRSRSADQGAEPRDDTGAGEEGGGQAEASEPQDSAQQDQPEQGAGHPDPADPMDQPGDGDAQDQGAGREPDREREDERDSSDPPEQEPDADQEGAPTPDGVDEEAQQQADEALRRQMDQALESDESQPVDGAAQAERAREDRREQEQRDAAEAWLRRIPDDPGGLLRARFRLEHERRVRQGAD